MLVLPSAFFIILSKILTTLEILTNSFFNFFNIMKYGLFWGYTLKQVHNEYAYKR